MKNIRRKNARKEAIKYQKMPTGHQHTEEYRERKSAKQRESKDVNGLRCHKMSINSRIIIRRAAQRRTRSRRAIRARGKPIVHQDRAAVVQSACHKGMDEGRAAAVRQDIGIRPAIFNLCIHKITY